MTNNEDGGTQSTLKVAGQIFGLFAGFATIIYVAGGFVLALRMFVYHLPALAVVGQLPKEFLISMGISQVLLPSALIAALYVLYRLGKGSEAAPPTVTPWSQKTATQKLSLFANELAIAASTLALAVSVAIVRIGWDRRLLILLVALLVTLVVVWAGLEVRARIVVEYGGDWNGAKPIARMAAVVALCAIPPSVATSGLVPLSDAQICAAGGIHYKGLFIGETSSRVYVGENVRPARIVSVPIAEVEELFLGEDAVSIACKEKQP